MLNHHCLLIVTTVTLTPHISLAGEVEFPIHFKVTNTHPRQGYVENIHASCIVKNADDELLCSMSFASLEYSSSNKGSNRCTVHVTPIEPMKFKLQTNGTWEYISKPSLLCGEVSTYGLSKDPEILGGWSLTIRSKETDLECVSNLNRKPAESSTTYSFGGGADLSCEYLSFTPGIF